MIDEVDKKMSAKIKQGINNLYDHKLLCLLRAQRKIQSIFIFEFFMDERRRLAGHGVHPLIFI